MNVVTKKKHVLMIDVRKYISVRYRAVFHVEFLCTNVCRYIFVCIIVLDCRYN